MNRHETFADRAAADETGLIGTILRALRHYPLAAEAVANELADREETRLSIVEQLLAHRERCAKVMPSLAAAEAAARKELAEIEPKYEAIVRKWQSARDMHALERHNGKWEEERLLQRIDTLADPEIDHAVAYLRRRLDEHFQDSAVVSDLKYGRDLGGNKILSTYATTLPALNARRVYLLDAINQAIAMKRDLDQSDVRERLAKLIEDIPEITSQIVQVDG